MLKKIILVFKSHFDIGFTDLAENVTRDYGGKMLREVIETCRSTENMGVLRYVWTMPSWPLRYIIDHCDPDLKPELDRLIRNGQIVDPWGTPYQYMIRQAGGIQPPSDAGFQTAPNLPNYYRLLDEERE